ANKFDQPETHLVEFAKKQCRRDAVLVGRSVDIDDDDLTAFTQGRSKPPQERIGLGDLVVHMDHEYAVEAVLRQPWVVLRTQLYRYVVESFVLDPTPQPAQRVLVDILGQHPSTLAD